MTDERSLIRRWAMRLTSHAGKAMPDSRSEWAPAASNELDAIAGDYAALCWALGAVSTSYKERVKIMRIGNSRISRWILGLEMLICFLPLTLLGIAVISTTVSGNMPAIYALVYLTAAAIGPIGLSIAFRAVVLQRVQLSRTALSVMCLFAGWTLLTYLGVMVALSGAQLSEWWRESFLIALLPAIGTAHLVFLSRQAPNQLAVN